MRLRFNKSIMAHRVYNFFHCYHGGLICAFIVVLIGLGVFVLVNPSDIVWGDIFTFLKDEASEEIQSGTNSKFKDFLLFVSPHFSFLGEKMGLFEIICLILAFIGIVAGIICGLMRKAAKCLIGFSVSFYVFSVFLLVTLKTTTGNFFEGLVVIWVLIAVVFMVLCHLILGGNITDATLRVVFTGFLAVILAVVGMVFAAFPAMISPVDDFNIYWISKFMCGGAMISFAFFHFDIMLDIFKELSGSESSGGIIDSINDMIGNEYIEGISGR